LKREVTGAGDGTVVFLAEAAERALSPDEAEKLRGYAARLEVALRTYSRAANDENRLVLPSSGPAQDWGWARQRGIFRVCSLTEVDAWPGS